MKGKSNSESASYCIHSNHSKCFRNKILSLKNIKLLFIQFRQIEVIGCKRPDIGPQEQRCYINDLNNSIF